MYTARGMIRLLARYDRKRVNRATWRGNVSARKPRTPRRSRPRCGAVTRKGTPCKARAVWDDELDRPVNGRCCCHGGASTGPRTGAGREAVRESNRRRAVLRDLAELAPELEDGRRERWCSAVLALVYGSSRRKGRYGMREAGEAAGVSRQTVSRWRQHPGFLEAARRARVRWWAWWRRDMRDRMAREAAARYGMPLSELLAYL